jgi:2-polyprenyl-3-methyl-5-hydroxy-6-metoxy-1,4-benzoquinol methylase
MPSLLRRAINHISSFSTLLDGAERQSRADQFLNYSHGSLSPSPNGRFWFQSMPLPDGTRILGASGDPCREQRLWSACFGPNRDAFAGKRVLDVGANDGFFSIAALLCGADSVHAINTPALAHGTFPTNLRYAAERWGVTPQVTVDDFLNLPSTGPKYDIVMFFGVLNHLENVYAGMRAIERLLAPGGTIFLETQISSNSSSLPLMELASDVYSTTVPQIRGSLDTVGNSNFLLPNELAVRALGTTFGLNVNTLPQNPYEEVLGGPGRRKVFILTRTADRTVRPKG